MTGPAAGYLAHPTISGDSVVFCCEDDLWQVPAAGGPAGRLTSGMSQATRPRLSPDGDRVAFCCQNDGPAEVYVLPTSGGTARRLTYQARCSVVGWHPGTGEILYASTAGQPTAFGYRLFAVSPDGGPSRLLPWGAASSVSFGPAGGIALGRSIADPARRKRYRGGAAGQLWLSTAAEAPFRRPVLPPGNLVDPCWVGDRVYFLSDHEATANVYSVLPDGSDLLSHSDHRHHYARNLATDGRRLVYQAGARVYLLDPADGRARPIDVQLASSQIQRARRFVAAADYLDGARLSPDGAELAVVARGKAFTFAPWSGPVRQHGTADGVRYSFLNRLADGTRLVAAAADSRPAEHLVLLPVDSPAPATEISLEGIGCVTELLASPATGQVAFATNRQQLWLLDTAADEPTPRLVDATAHERIEDLAWSSDGRWLAYTYPDTARTSAIKVVEARTGRTFAVTEPVFRDCRPAFDPAGRYLYFIGQRDLTPDLDQVQFDVGFPFGARPYLVTLRAREPSPFGPGAPLPAEAPDASPVTDIEFPGIARRVVALPVAEGRYATVLGLPDRVLLLRVPVAAPDPATGGRDPEGTVTAVNLATGEVTADYLDGVDELSTDARSRTVLYRSGTRLRVLAADADSDKASEQDVPWAAAGRPSGWLDLNRVRVAVRPATEWHQMFREAWRLQREAFWDEAMSDLDWDAMYERYFSLLELVGCRSELSDLLWELQGELASSHAYERGGDYGHDGVHGRPQESSQPPGQGFLGVDWAEPEPGDRRPAWRIAGLLRGDSWNESATSPCNRPGTDIRPGDEVLAVNGQPLGRPGPGELLVGQAGREVELTLARAGSPGRRVTVRAVADESRARYLDWVDGNRAHVHAVSEGRLGYLHVPDMSADGYADFIRGFLSELDRDGLVVDVRFNGGGHVSPLLLDRLSRRRGGAEHGRWTGAVPYPPEAPRGPMVVLINEETGSDGELFAHLFRDRGLGLLVGRRTWGGTIATWPRRALVDGTVTTQPEFCYDLSNVGRGLENQGVHPDVEVELEPRRDGRGGRHEPAEDLQLGAAVRVLGHGLGERPSGTGQWSGRPARAAAVPRLGGRPR
jgi:tricorn protease